MQGNDLVAQAVLDDMVAAWAAGDAKAYAALFAEQATCVLRSGYVAHGRAEIEAAFAYAFAGTHRGSTLEDCRVVSATATAAAAAADDDDGKERRIDVVSTRTVVRGVARNTFSTTMTLRRDPAGAWRVHQFSAAPASGRPPSRRGAGFSAAAVAAAAVAAVACFALGALFAVQMQRRRRGA